MNDIVAEARELAEQKHANHRIPDEVRTQMFDHITEVAELVCQAGGSEAMIAAAWLHDVVEDTDVTLAQVGGRFGAEVQALVDGLTDPPHFAAMPLEQRKQLQADRLSSLDDQVKLIKLCDQLSNIRRVLARPPYDWTEDKQWTYIQGAKKITDHCRNISAALDEQFQLAFTAAQRRYG